MLAQENSIFALMELAEFVCISHSDERCIAMGHDIGQADGDCFTNYFNSFFAIEYFRGIFSIRVISYRQRMKNHEQNMDEFFLNFQ